MLKKALLSVAFVLLFCLIFIQCKIKLTKRIPMKKDIGLITLSSNAESLGLYPKFIPKEEILKLNCIKGKYYNIYYSQGFEEKANYAYEILNKGDSIIKEITDLNELEKIKYNYILLDTLGNFYTDIQPISSIVTKDLISDSVKFKENIFTMFHEKVEHTLGKYYLINKDSMNRFVGDGLAELAMWELMALFWPERFYYLSERLADYFGKDTVNKIYDLSNWKFLEMEKLEIKSKALESLLSEIKVEPKKLDTLLPIIIESLLPIMVARFKQRFEEQ